MKFLYHASVHSKLSLRILPICGCNTFVPRKHNSLPYLGQKRSASYYTFPLFTGAQYLLENFHALSSLPWWCTIVGTTLILRTSVTLPLAIRQHKNLAKMELLKPELKEITESVKYNVAVRGKRDGKTERQMKIELIKELRYFTKDFYRQHKVSPMKLFLLPWVQMPLWITMSFALRNICGYTYLNAADTGEYLPSPGIETEGILWFSNLAIPDQYYILPAIILITNLLNMEMSALRTKEPKTFEIFLTKVFRGFTVLLFAIATQVPSAMSLYWASSSTYGLTQNIIMKFPKVRRKLNIQKTPSEHERPFVTMREVAKLRTKNFLDVQRKR